MLIKQAYEAGKKIKKVLQSKCIDVKPVVYRFKQAVNLRDLSSEYLKVCLDYNIENDNEFMVQMLDADEEDITQENVSLSLCLGIMSEDDEYISFVEAAKRWKLNRTTLQKSKDNKRFNSNEWKKEGRNLYVKVSAMERLYGKQKLKT